MYGLNMVIAPFQFEPPVNTPSIGIVAFIAFTWYYMVLGYSNLIDISWLCAHQSLMGPSTIDARTMFHCPR